MPRTSSKSAMASTEFPMPASPGAGSPTGYEMTPRPRKKLSFKEPETYNNLHLKMRKSVRPKLMIHAQNSLDLSFDENPFEEENDDLDELEVKGARERRRISRARLSETLTREKRDK